MALLDFISTKVSSQKSLNLIQHKMFLYLLYFRRLKGYLPDKEYGLLFSELFKTIELLSQNSAMKQDIKAMALYLLLNIKEGMVSHVPPKVMKNKLKILSLKAGISDNKGDDQLFLNVALLTKNKENALALCVGLIESYPQSLYLYDCIRKIADDLYNRRDYLASIRYYDKLADSSDVLDGFYALYKSSWSYYQLGQEEKAFDHLERLGEHTRRLSHRVSGIDEASFVRNIDDDLLYMYVQKKDAKFVLKRIEKSKRLVESKLLIKLAVNYAFAGKPYEFKNVISFLLKSTRYQKDVLRILDVLAEKLQLRIEKKEAQQVIASTLVSLKEYMVLKEYIIQLAKSFAYTKEIDSQIIRGVINLEKEEKWRQTFEILWDLKNKGGIENREHELLMQRSAFNHAKKLKGRIGKSKDQKKVVEVREWMERSLLFPRDNLYVVKAVSELVNSFSLLKDSLGTVKIYGRYEADLAKAAPSYSRCLRCIFNIHVKVAWAYKNLNRDYDRATHLVRAAEYTLNNEKHEQLYWESARIYGSYCLVDKMKPLLFDLKSFQNYKEDVYVETARVMYECGNLHKAWGLVKPFLERGTSKKSKWILYRDLYFKSKYEKYNELHSLLKEWHRSKYQKLKSFRGLVQIHHVEYYDAIVADYQRSVAKYKEVRALQKAHRSLLEKKRMKQFWVRLFKLEDLMIDLIGLKNLVLGFKNSPIPAISRLGYCQLAKENRAGIKFLEELENPPLKPEFIWEAFKKKLSSKESEISLVANEEQNTCDQLLHKSSLVTDKRISLSLFEGYEKPNNITFFKWVLNHEANEREMQKRVVEKYFNYLRIGAKGRARLLLEDVSGDEILLGVGRIFEDDAWNSYHLLKGKSEKDDIRNLLISYLYLFSGNKDIAAIYFDRIVESNREEWFNTIYKAIDGELDRNYNIF